MFKKILVVFFLILSIIVAIWISKKLISPDSNYENIQNIRNEDLRWDGDISGLTVSYGKQIANVISSAKDNSMLKVCLKNALNDDSKIAIAHVLLSEIYGNHLPSTSTSWNGLDVSISAKNVVKYDPQCFGAIRDYWNAKLRDSDSNLFKKK